MCARYTSTAELDRLLSIFMLGWTKYDYSKRYNIAPTQTVPVILDIAPDGLEGAKWGLIPHWAKDAGIGSKMVNARAETLHEKPSFRGLVTKRRCLLPADGYYEWFEDVDGRKTPVHFGMADDSPFLFAGLWDEWTNTDGKPVRTCTIITTAGNELTAKVHDRMPVILDREEGYRWLGSETRGGTAWRELLVPYPAGKMRSYQVGRKVNSSKVEGPDLILPEDNRKRERPSDELPGLFD